MLKSIFAIEICFRMDPSSPILPALRSCIEGQAARTGFAEKWRAMRQASELMVAHLPNADRGCWDYFDNDTRATNDFDMWVKGMTTAEGARTAPSGLPDPYRGDPRFLTFTMAFLMVQNSPTDLAMRALCNIPEAQLWSRQTFAHLLNGMGNLNFASVMGDVMYLIPREGDWGLTVSDLAEPKFEYLRTIV